ncbi:hypothetical protein ABEY51_11535 [Priestia megaterium]
MEGETNVRDIVVKYLGTHKINNGKLETLREKVQKHLIVIESYFQDYIEIQEDISLKIKDMNLSVANVCDRTNIPRSSIYNNSDTLKVYIEERIKEIEQIDKLSINKHKKIQTDMELLKKYLDNTAIRLVENNILQSKITQLEEEVLTLNQINDRNGLEIGRLQNENEKLKFDLLKLKKKDVLPFKQ